MTFRRKICYTTVLEPTASRAWIFQERVLAPRILSFGSSLIWFCPKMQRIDERTGDELWVRCVDLKGTAGAVGFPRSSDIFERWHELVTAYSTRRMTLPSDKLPALSNLAKKIACKASCSSALRMATIYIAGSERLRCRSWMTDITYGGKIRGSFRCVEPRGLLLASLHSTSEVRTTNGFMMRRRGSVRRERNDFAVYLLWQWVT